ncbi:hypothetical protein FOZ62_031533 [Perkinsus olseni]|uniref:HAT C-terminal dimerisation domain-containing protein n=1 Tax=Perkinsus olseni TaxID=32597 RepID=A0A7J6QGJ1_PEROL|nr:hypothetical protein FOZ62_031533 [Perkinsus olseni]
MFDPALKLQGLLELPLLQEYHRIHSDADANLLTRSALVSAFTTWVINSNSPRHQEGQNDVIDVGSASTRDCGASDPPPGAPVRRKSLTDSILNRRALPGYKASLNGSTGDIVDRAEREAQSYLSLESHGTPFDEFWNRASSEYPMIYKASQCARLTILSTGNVESTFSQIREQLSLRRTSMKCNLIKAVMTVRSTNKLPANKLR